MPGLDIRTLDESQLHRPRAEINRSRPTSACSRSKETSPSTLRRSSARAPSAIAVKTRAELDRVDALVIPGGESTTVMKLLDRASSWPSRSSSAFATGMPFWGTCMGMIVRRARRRGASISRRSDCSTSPCGVTHSDGKTSRPKSTSRFRRSATASVPGDLHSRAVDRARRSGGRAPCRARRARRDGAPGNVLGDVVPSRAAGDSRVHAVLPGDGIGSKGRPRPRRNSLLVMSARGRRPRDTNRRLSRADPAVEPCSPR